MAIIKPASQHRVTNPSLISRHRWTGMALCVALAGWGAAAQAQYPDRPIRMLVPLAAGGSTDIVARSMLAPAMSAILGQQVIIENVTGAGGQIAYETLSRARPDGYTVMLATVSATALKLTNKGYNLDVASDFTPITKVEERPVWIGVPKALPMKNMAEFVAYAKANPGKLNYGAGGTLDVLATAWLHKVAGIETTIIRYRGGAPAIQAVAASEVHYTWNFPNVMKPLVDSDKVRIFAMSGTRRSADFPDVPAIAETYPEYSWTSWTGLLAPKGTPDAVVDRLYRAVKEALARPDVVQRLKQMGTEPALSASPAEFARAARAETDRWAGIATAAKIVPE